MTYLCFIDSSIQSVPHMEPLASTTRDEAVGEAIDLMRLHSSATAVHIFYGEEKIETIFA